MEQETLTLTLPFIRLKEDQCVDVESSYEESGVFFVQDSIGNHYLVEVNKTAGYASVFGLPPHIQNLFTEQQTENKLAAQLRWLDERLYENHKETEAHLTAMKDDIMSGVGETLAVSRFCQSSIMELLPEIKSYSSLHGRLKPLSSKAASAKTHWCNSSRKSRNRKEDQP